MSSTIQVGPDRLVEHAPCDHPRPDVVDASTWIVEPPVSRSLDGAAGDALVTEAGTLARTMPAALHDALVAFADRGHRSGALLVRGVDHGPLPPTPARPEDGGTTTLRPELALLAVARRLGQPVGYLPELGGKIVQDIVPVRETAAAQVSTSSDCDLMFHTETAFHPHRPRFLVLSCLRGDPSAVTTLASVHHLLDHLDHATIQVLRAPRFRLAVDASFLGGRPNRLGPPRPVLEGTRAEPTFVFDADLMVGVDDEAERAVRTVRDLIVDLQTGVVLEPGDVLVVDNHQAVHGRSRFRPRFDGTDRWLQRTFVVADLSPSAADRHGRVITTQFGEGAESGAW